MQRDSHVGVEAEAKTTVAEVFRANDSGSTHTIQPNSENLINGCRPMLSNMTPVTRSEQGNNRSRVSESLNPCFSRGGETRVEFPMPTKKPCIGPVSYRSRSLRSNIGRERVKTVARV